MFDAKKLLSDRMADNRSVKPDSEPSTESYQFAGSASGGKAFVKTIAGEILPADLATNGYIKPGQTVDVTDSGKLTIEAMPKVKSSDKPKPGVVRLKYKVKILYFIDNAQSNKTEVWIGGDRFTPKKITEFNLTSDIKGLIHNLGKDDKFTLSLRVGENIYTYHSEQTTTFKNNSFTHASEDVDKLKRARLNPVGHGYFAEFRDPYIQPVEIPNSAIGDLMFASFDALFPEICTNPNTCTSSGNDDQAGGAGNRSQSESNKNYSLKPWAFYKGDVLEMLPDATRTQTGTYGEEPNDIIETNDIIQSVLLSPDITREVKATDDRNRVERKNGGATGSQSWYFNLKLSHPKEPDKYFEFSLCSDSSPALSLTKTPFRTNADPRFNTSILVLTANGKNIFSHKGESFVDAVGYEGPESYPSLQPYTWIISIPAEVDGDCEVPEDLPDDGPDGINRECYNFWSDFGLRYISGDYSYPCGTPKGSKPSPTLPAGQPYFESYFDKASLHWRTEVMGDKKQVIAKRSEYAVSNGPSPSPVTAIDKEEHILISVTGQEIVLGGTLPVTIGPKDNMIESLYYWVNDALYFSQNPPPKSSIRELDLTEYNLGESTTKKTSKETIYPIPDNAIVQNCSYHPE